MTETNRGAAYMGGLIGGARRGLGRMGRDLPWPPIGAPWNDMMPGKWQPDPETGLPPGCPVQALGTDNQTMYLVDSIGQLFEIPPGRQMGQDVIQRLFGAHYLYLYWAWPRWKEARNEDDPPTVSGWRAEAVRECLYAACARKGVWRPQQRVRGVGAWRDDQDRLIIHAGSVVHIDGVPNDPGEIDSFFYPRGDDVLHPWANPVGDDINPAPQLVNLFRTWTWKRPDADPVLLLGTIAAMLIGGALAWRPAGFLVGDAGSGKSTAQRLIKTLMGRLLLSTVNTTQAGIYQELGFDSRPVAIDELEASEDNRRAMQVIELMRVSSSGGSINRGGANHSGTSFTAQSVFLFSAINPPPMKAQDHSRIVTFNLGPLDEAKISPGGILLKEKIIRTWGPMLLRRLMDNWADFPRLFTAYMGAMRAGGHDTRGQETYGTFLACAHLALGDEGLRRLGFNADDVTGWADVLGVAHLPELAEKIPNWRQALSWLLSARVEVWRGGARTTVGQVLDDLRGTFPVGEGREIGPTEARNLLQQAGLGLCEPGSCGDLPGWVLAVPNKSQLVGELFRGSTWSDQNWAGALRQAPEHIVCNSARLNRVRISGEQVRCALVVLDALDAVPRG